MRDLHIIRVNSAMLVKHQTDKMVYVYRPSVAQHAQLLNNTNKESSLMQQFVAQGLKQYTRTALQANGFSFLTT